MQFQCIFFELHFWSFLFAVFQIRDQFTWAMRDPDPGVRIVFIRRSNSDLNSIFTVQTTGYNFQYGSSFGVASDPTKWFRCFFLYWQRVYSRQATASVNCENYAVSFVMKYCPISTTLKKPPTIQNLLSLSRCDNFSIRSLYCCNKKDLCEHGDHNPKALLSWSILARMRNSIVLPQPVAPYDRERFRILHTFMRLLRKDWADWQK